MRYVIEVAGADDRNAILKVMEPWNMHNVPSSEMEELDLSCFFVARVSDRIVGAAGYKILSPVRGKTTLLSVLPEFSGYGIGKALQDARLDAMHAAGVKTVITNADRARTILWYIKHYDYRQVGTLKKICSFGLPDIDHWTTLEMDLEAFYRDCEEKRAARLRYIDANDPPPLSPYPPLIINACLTGMMPTKLSTPYVPTSPDEIIEDAIRAYDAGARIVHLHARDDAGMPTPDTQDYEKIICTLHRERPGLICCATTSGRNWSEFEQRSEVLRLTDDAKPDMASLTLGSMNFQSGPSVNPIEIIEHLALTMRDNGIKPELEVFDLGMVSLAKYLERHGLIRGRKYFNILLGNINTAPANIGNLATLYAALPDNSIWAAAGLSGFQLPMNVAAIVAGGHVRVGIEDSIHYDYARNVLASNEALIKRVVRIADEMQRPIATAKQTRQLLEIDGPESTDVRPYA